MNSSNFGETMAYWYLRLNGFFPLPNFVLHRTAILPRTADCDILAVRFPFAYEQIGGQSADWDTWFFEECGLSLNSSIIGLIVEVKTGYEDNPQRLVAAVNRAFAVDRLSYAIQRLGFWPPERAMEVAECLSTERLYVESHKQTAANSVVVKLLISTYFPDSDEVPPCFQMSLQHVEDFICTRMEVYKDRKYRDRMFFPSDLIQHLIWKCTA
jgi:hypothetical protein